MRYSYSSISTFSNCPYRWYLQYCRNLKTIPETNAENPLWCGLALHKGIEIWDVQAGLDEYKSHYNLITDENVNWMIQLEYQLQKVLQLLPEGGEHEIEIQLPNFIGFVDYVCGNVLYDFKFTNNIDNYLHSPQLSLYKHYLSIVMPDIYIEHTKFMFVPKINIRRKKDESIFEFRERLQEHLEASEIKFVEVPYSEDSVTQFESCCQQLDTVKSFPKNETRLCQWCNFKQYCQSDEKEDWMIL